MSMFQAMFLPLAVLLVFYTAPSNGVGYLGVCSATLSCDTELFLACNKRSTSCREGLCNCAPGYTRSNSKCVKLVYHGDACELDSSVRLENGECVNGVVACKSGFTKVSNALCVDVNVKTLGEKCNPATDSCRLYTDITTGSGTCSREYCGCFGIWVGKTCRNEQLGDSCERSSNCPGSSHCVSAKCQCVAGEREYRGDCYLPDDYGSKKAGENCDVNDKCELGLECSTCQENFAISQSTCNQPAAGSSRRLADVFTILSVSLVTMSRLVF